MICVGDSVLTHYVALSPFDDHLWRSRYFKVQPTSTIATADACTVPRVRPVSKLYIFVPFPVHTVRLSLPFAIRLNPRRDSPLALSRTQSPTKYISGCTNSVLLFVLSLSCYAREILWANSTLVSLALLFLRRWLTSSPAHVCGASWYLGVASRQCPTFRRSTDSY